MSVPCEQRAARTTGLELGSYRAVSSLAVISCLATVVSFAALLDWWLNLIPAFGIVTGLIAWRRIATRPEDLAGKPLAIAGVVGSTLLMCGGLGRLTYVEATEAPRDAIRINYDQLQPDPTISGQVVPPAALALEGKRVFIKGYAFPGGQQTGIKQFVLVRDNNQCCFGGNPQLTDMIEVTLRGSLEMTYTTRMRKLAGTFHVRVGQQGVDGLRAAIYHLDADYLQ
jgi:hypothetical protein